MRRDGQDEQLEVVFPGLDGIVGTHDPGAASTSLDVIEADLEDYLAESGRARPARRSWRRR